MEGDRRTARSPGYVTALWFLIFLFFLRIVGQLIQTVHPVVWLPPLTAWQGSTLPYTALLASQLATIIALTLVARRHAAGEARRNHRLGGWLLLAGLVYFLGMTGRLVIGLADLTEQPWFHQPVPAGFHLVLASFVLILAAYHLNWLNMEQR